MKKIAIVVGDGGSVDSVTAMAQRLARMTSPMEVVIVGPDPISFGVDFSEIHIDEAKNIDPEQYKKYALGDWDSVDKDGRIPDTKEAHQRQIREEQPLPKFPIADIYRI